MTGEPVLLSITVYNASPQDIQAEIINIPEGFKLISAGKEPRWAESSGVFSGNRIPTVYITYEWVPENPGFFTLGPFNITAPAEHVSLPQVSIHVMASPGSTHASLRWKVHDGQPVAGVPVRILLEGLFTGTVTSLICPPPENALLERLQEELPSGEIDEKNGEPWLPLAVFSWTPLVYGKQPLPEAFIEYITADGKKYTLSSIPEEISISAPSAHTAETSIPDSPVLRDAFSSSGDDNRLSGGETSLAEIKMFADMLQETERVPEVLALAEYFRQGLYAEALALLRRAEYTKLFPGKYRNIRTRAEEILGFEKTLSVPNTVLPWCIILVSILTGLTLLIKKRVSGTGVPGLWVYIGICAIICMIGFASVARLHFYHAGVTVGTDVYHIPELNAGIMGSLPAGTPVRIVRTAEKWVYIQTAQNQRGWVPALKVIEYTTGE
ncbi:SH3 domain-containing protein [Brucepastera parasyntrophica]|uniref:SH3 domain-containing protein n=1 Tax=Brucepastera parasyntrophica TaxID=2880008 RepID=UPI00210C8B31|nr:SH3 domain-containing protein [Brucepastera parasyntrophica]ULQ60699.1 SH3 domain-containing protein [Brucepastera parasyntrophica]